MDITEISVALIAAYPLARGTLGEAGKIRISNIRAGMDDAGKD